jgi:hypothetical protein
MKGKSLAMSSNGVDFDRFMKALVAVPSDEIKKEIAKEKARNSRKRKKKAER